MASWKICLFSCDQEAEQSTALLQQQSFTDVTQKLQKYAEDSGQLKMEFFHIVRNFDPAQVPLLKACENLGYSASIVLCICLFVCSC